MVNTRKKNQNVHKNKSKIKSNKKYKQKNTHKTHIRRKTNLINTKKNIFNFQGGVGEKTYKSVDGTIMQLVYMDKPIFIFRDLKQFFKTRSPHYFIKHYPSEWEMVKKMWFFNSNKSLIKNGLESLEKGVYYLNYVYHYQAKVRSILYDLRNLIEKRVKLIFNTIVTEDELLSIKDNQKKTSLKGGEPIELNPYNIILQYGTSQGIAGPSNSDFERLKEHNDSYGLFDTLSDTFKKFSKKLFYSFNPKNTFKGVILRYETDKLYFEIADKYKSLKKSLTHLASSQQKLYIYYLNSIYFNDVILKYINISDSDVKELESLNEEKKKKYKQIIALKPIFNGINEYTKKFKHDYQEIVKMYEQSINGFWIQDDNGRIIFNFYKTNEEAISEKKIKQIMKEIKIEAYLDQIASNIMGQIYLKISKKDLELVNKTQPRQTFLEVRTIAQERFCYSRIMVQYFIWDMLLKSQGFDINIDEMLKDPSKPIIKINEKIEQDKEPVYHTSLVAKMLLADQNLEVVNDHIEWNNNNIDGLKSYFAFATIFGYYDNNLINMGIRKHPILQKIDKSKEQVNQSLKDDILKMMPKQMRGGDYNEKKLAFEKIKQDLIIFREKHPSDYTQYREYKNKIALFHQLKKYLDGLKKKNNNLSYKPIEVLKLSGTQNNKVKPERQSISITKTQIINGKQQVTSVNEEQMGWFDIWKRNFLQNFRVFSRLIDSYMNYSFNRDENKIQPDVYFLFYRDKILKQFVSAFTGCGMLDILYRVFHNHISNKTSIEKTTRELLNNQYTVFKNKLPYICMASQIAYTYPLLFNSENNVDLLDEHFQVRLGIANTYIDTIFKKYDDITSNDITPNDSYEIIQENYAYYIKLIKKHKNSFVNFNIPLNDDVENKLGTYFDRSIIILKDASKLETEDYNNSKYNIGTIINKGNINTIMEEGNQTVLDNRDTLRSFNSDDSSLNSNESQANTLF